MGSLSIADLDPAEVLAALYNASKPEGAGHADFDPRPMDIRDARRLLEQQRSFDLLQGRVLGVDLSNGSIDVRRYDSVNGVGAAAIVLANLRRRQRMPQRAGRQSLRDAIGDWTRRI